MAIFGMGLATYATRIFGLLLMRGVVVKGRMKAALDAMPPSVLMAVITPTVLMTGKAETIAAVIAAISAMLRLPLLATIVIGVASLWGLKFVLEHDHFKSTHILHWRCSFGIPAL